MSANAQPCGAAWAPMRIRALALGRLAEANIDCGLPHVERGGNFFVHRGGSELRCRYEVIKGGHLAAVLGISEIHIVAHQHLGDDERLVVGRRLPVNIVASKLEKVKARRVLCARRRADAATQQSHH